MRIFTNEVATVNALERVGERLVVTAWEERPVFGKLTGEADLDLFAKHRAAVYADAGWDEDHVVEADFRLRNAELREALESGEPFTLLFGGSLRDQLQLAQILYWLSFRSQRALKQAKLMVVDGPLSIFEEGAMLEVAKAADDLSFEVLDAYRSAWLAVTAGDAMNVEFAFRRLAGTGQTTLASALERWLQELPSAENGLSITQAQILDTVRLGVQAPQEIFELVEETESAPFRVNWEYWQLLDDLCGGDLPLLKRDDDGVFLCPPRSLAWDPFHAQRLVLTERGQSVLEGEAHYAKGPFAARWLGGALIDGNSSWYWDYASRSIVDAPCGAAKSGA